MGQRQRRDQHGLWESWQATPEEVPSRVSRCSTGQPDLDEQYLNGRNINDIWCIADDPPALAASPFRYFYVRHH